MKCVSPKMEAKKCERLLGVSSQGTGWARPYLDTRLRSPASRRRLKTTNGASRLRFVFVAFSSFRHLAEPTFKSTSGACMNGTAGNVIYYSQWRSLANRCRAPHYRSLGSTLLTAHPSATVSPGRAVSMQLFKGSGGALRGAR